MPLERHAPAPCSRNSGLLRLATVAYRIRSWIAGENIAEGTDSDLTVLKSWLDFSDTRQVILDREARGFGFAFYQEATGKIWWVQLIGR